MLTSASLTGLAVSPVVAGSLGATTMRGVFVLDVVVLAVLAAARAARDGGEGSGDGARRLRMPDARACDRRDRLSIDPIAPDAGAIEAAARAIRAGGMVALPTDTLYGLAADPFNADALAAYPRLKERPAERAIPLVAADVDQIAATLGVLPMLARLLATASGPGR